MAKCDPFHFTGITPAAFQQISRELATKGFPLTGTHGQVKGPFGVVINYAWDSQSETLTVEVLDKSFLVSCDQIHRQLESALTKFTASR